MKTKFIKKSYAILSLFFITSLGYSQTKFLTKQGYVSFYSSAIVEDIKADNNQVLSVVDTKDGSVAIVMLMKSFLFEKSLMQEHFNENYVESDIYPKATFKGKITDFEGLKEGYNDVGISGRITIHGITREINVKAELIKKENQLSLYSKFSLSVADFNIQIPAVVVNNIAKVIDVTLETVHKPYGK